MKTLIFLLLSQISNAAWTEGTVIGVRDDNTTKINALFVNSYTGTGPTAGVWNVVDVSVFGLDNNVKSLFLSGILIITHGLTFELCDMSLAIRAYGDPMNPGNYIGQATEAAIGGGQRSTMATFVPIRNGKFEYMWNRSTQGQWPTHCSYGLNLTLQAYVK